MSAKNIISSVVTEVLHSTPGKENTRDFQCSGHMYTYGTTRMQVDGLIRVQVLVLKYSRTNTRVENTSAQHKHDTTTHAISLNRRAESFMS